MAGVSAVEGSDRRVCRLSFCTLWAQGESPFCHNHKSLWYAVGSPEIEEFVRRCEAAGDDRALGRALVLAGWMEGGRRGRHLVRLQAAERALVHYRRSTWPVSSAVWEMIR